MDEGHRPAGNGVSAVLEVIIWECPECGIENNYLLAEDEDEMTETECELCGAVIIKVEKDS